MAYKKVIKNKPFTGARGQYSFDASTNMGTYPYTDDKFLDKDLYSFNIGEEINEVILTYNNTFNNSTLPIQSNSHFTIDKLKIINSGVSHDLNHVRFSVYIIDSQRNSIKVYRYI